jgi:hypothetical protein
LATFSNILSLEPFILGSNVFLSVVLSHKPDPLFFSYPFKDEAQTVLFKDPVRTAQ